MPRTKDFEPALALDQAMGLFWRSGYASTSFDRLVSRTKASRYGLYATFGSKRQLLARALDQYTQKVVEPMVAPLRDPAASLAEIRAFFRGVVALHARAGASGCLNCNTALELGQARSAPALHVRDHFANLRALLLRALGNARRDGHLPPQLDTQHYADYLVGVTAGSFLLARASMQPGLILAFLRVAVDGLDRASARRKTSTPDPAELHP